MKSWRFSNRLRTRQNVPVTNDNTSKNGDDKTENNAQTSPCSAVKRVDEIYDFSSDDWKFSDLPVTAENLALDSHLHRNVKDEFDGFVFLVVRRFEKPLSRYSMLSSNSKNTSFETLLEIRSPQLKRACKDVIGDVQGISWTATPFRACNIFFS